jgi:chromosome segregation ATPase
VTKTSERELRDLLETAQAEVKHLRAKLADQEKTAYASAQQQVQQELQPLRAHVAMLEKQKAFLELELAATSHELKSTQALLHRLTRRKEGGSLWVRMREFFTRENA